jgi:hypothetical protein
MTANGGVVNYILNQTKDFVKKEKSFTVLILKNLKHIQEHRLFAKLGYPSLYKYLIKELKYSEGEANIRVANVKLMRRSKAANEKILKGELSLTNGRDIFRGLDQGKDIDEEKIIKVIGEIKNKSTREAQNIIAQLFELETPKEEKLVLRGEILVKLNRLKEKHKIDSTLELLEILFDRDLKEIKVKKDVVVKEKKSRYIPVKVKATTIARAQSQCEYVGASGKRCCEKRHLQFEHVKPFALGGNNIEENILLYCRAHNQLTAIEIFGQQKIYEFYGKVC